MPRIEIPFSRETLTAPALEARRQYQREYRKSHPEKCREYRRRYWEKRATNETPSKERTENHE